MKNKNQPKKSFMDSFEKMNPEAQNKVTGGSAVTPPPVEITPPPPRQHGLVVVEL